MQLKKRILSIFLMLALLLSLGSAWPILAEQNQEGTTSDEFVSEPSPETSDEADVNPEPETEEADAGDGVTEGNESSNAEAPSENEEAEPDEPDAEIPEVNESIPGDNDDKTDIEQPEESEEPSETVDDEDETDPSESEAIEDIYYDITVNVGDALYQENNGLGGLLLSPDFSFSPMGAGPGGDESGSGSSPNKEGESGVAYLLELISQRVYASKSNGNIYYEGSNSPEDLNYGEGAELIDPDDLLYLDFTYRVPIVGDERPEGFYVKYGDKARLFIAEGFAQTSNHPIHNLVVGLNKEDGKDEEGNPIYRPMSAGEAQFTYEDQGYNPGRLYLDIVFNGDEEFYRPKKGADIYFNLRFTMALKLSAVESLHPDENGHTYVRILDKYYPVRTVNPVEGTDLEKKGTVDLTHGKVNWAIKIQAKSNQGAEGDGEGTETAKAMIPLEKLILTDDLTQAGDLDKATVGIFKNEYAEDSPADFTLTIEKKDPSEDPKDESSSAESYALKVILEGLEGKDVSKEGVASYQDNNLVLDLEKLGKALGITEFHALTVDLVTTLPESKYYQSSDQAQQVGNTVKLIRNPGDNPQTLVKSAFVDFTPTWFKKRGYEKPSEGPVVDSIKKEVSWELMVNPYGTTMHYPYVEEVLPEGLTLKTVEIYSMDLGENTIVENQTLDAIYGSYKEASWGDPRSYTNDEINSILIDGKSVRNEEQKTTSYRIMLLDSTERPGGHDGYDSLREGEEKPVPDDPNAPTNKIYKLVITASFKGVEYGDQDEFFGQKLDWLNNAQLAFFYPEEPTGLGWKPVRIWRGQTQTVNKDALEKKGSFNEEDGLIDWTVSYIPSGQGFNEDGTFKKDVKEFRIFDLLVHGDNKEWSALKKNPEQLELSYEGASSIADVTNIDDENDLRNIIWGLNPGYHMTYHSTKHTDGNPLIKVITITVPSESGESETVADLLVVKVGDLKEDPHNDTQEDGSEPGLNDKSYSYSFKAKPDNVAFRQEVGRLHNEASLYTGDKKIVTAQADVDLPRVLGKSWLSSTEPYDAYVENEDADKTSDLQDKLLQCSTLTSSSNGNGFNFIDRSLVYKLTYSSDRMTQIIQDKLILTDTLPEALNYVSSVAFVGTKTEVDGKTQFEWTKEEKIKAEKSTDSKQTTLKFDLTNYMTSDQVVIFVKAKLDESDEEFSYKDAILSDGLLLKNHAELVSQSGDSEPFVVDNSVSLKVKPKLVSKSIDKDHQAGDGIMQWHIDYLSSNELDLKDDPVIIEDIFPKYMDIPNGKLDDARISIQELVLQPDGTYLPEGERIAYPSDDFNKIVSVEYEPPAISQANPGSDETSVYKSGKLKFDFRQQSVEDKSSYRIFYRTEIRLPETNENGKKFTDKDLQTLFSSSYKNQATITINGEERDSMSVMVPIMWEKATAQINYALNFTLMKKSSSTGDIVPITTDNFRLQRIEDEWGKALEPKEGENFLRKPEENSSSLEGYYHDVTENKDFGHLRRGKYILTEVKPPEGYVGVKDSWRINVDINPDYPMNGNRLILRIETNNNRNGWNWDWTNGDFIVKNDPTPTPSTNPSKETPPTTAPILETTVPETTPTTIPETTPTITGETTETTTEETTTDVTESEETQTETSEPSLTESTPSTEESEPSEPTVPGESSEPTVPTPTSTPDQPIAQTGEQEHSALLGGLLLLMGIALFVLRRRHQSL